MRARSIVTEVVKTTDWRVDVSVGEEAGVLVVMFVVSSREHDPFASPGVAMPGIRILVVIRELVEPLEGVEVLMLELGRWTAIRVGSTARAVYWDEGFRGSSTASIPLRQGSSV